MSGAALSASAENYVKIVWGLQEWSAGPVTPSAIAARAGVGMSTVSEAVRKLAARGLVEHTPYGAVSLTDAGRVVAVGMVRRHRLIETFLHDVLGYSWDEVHDEADVLEHAVSDLFIDRVDRLLGRPDRDPHGDPIPDAAGAMEELDAVALAQLTGPTRVRVERVSDADVRVLQFCADNAVGIGAVFTAAPQSGNDDGPGWLLTGVQGVSVPVPPEVAGAVFVSIQSR